jgi:glyoxylase-like metal-dependent hydrolase (beta-lactamase superfamily II)/8-oxo-dGTP pyrophosphatase MutT (NUDIX family)
VTGVEPRPAATVALLRDGDLGLEALLTHRPASMAFAGDMHVFPGGRVDAADADPRFAARSTVNAHEAAIALGGDLPAAAALATYVAAIRELFEEVGVLLADTGAGGDTIDAARRHLLRDAAAFPAIAEALDLRLRTDALVPISRWVTPPGLSRRFDTRFFVATPPEGAEATLQGDEVVAVAWRRPLDALDAMADGRLGLWLPTSTTLQQLAFVRSVGEVRHRMTPGRLGGVVVDEAADGVVRIEMPAGGGVAGQPVNAYLVGRRSFVLVDPGDPTGDALDRAVAEATDRGGTIRAIALTHADPDHAAGAEALREQLGIPVLVGPGGGRHLPYPTVEIANGTIFDDGDLAWRVVETPGPRADHLAFVVGDDDAAAGAGSGPVVLAGDLDGVRGARSVLGPPDDDAWTRSEARLQSVAPGARWLGGHGP